MGFSIALWLHRIPNCWSNSIRCVCLVLVSTYAWANVRSNQRQTMIHTIFSVKGFSAILPNKGGGLTDRAGYESAIRSVLEQVNRKPFHGYRSLRANTIAKRLNEKGIVANASSVACFLSWLNPSWLVKTTGQYTGKHPAVRFAYRG